MPAEYRQKPPRPRSDGVRRRRERPSSEARGGERVQGRERAGYNPLVVTLTLLLALTAAACTGGRHREGDRQAVFSASYGEPITSDSFGFVGNGDAPNVGLAAGSQWFLKDRWAVGVQAGVRYYDQTGGAAFGLEIEGTARHYLFELGSVGFLFEVSGGGQWASRDVRRTTTASGSASR